MDVKVYPGRYRRPYFSADAKVIFNSSSSEPLKKLVAFDLDETLGNFSDLGLLWVRVSPKTQTTFNALLNAYPEFLRVGILSVLQFLKKKIDAGECNPIFIYTNNQCDPDSWVNYIILYFESKTGVRFARPICAYKIGNKRIELNRTTNSKIYDDFVKCSMIETPFELCFIDDRHYSGMRKAKVYYIQPPPYVHNLPKPEIEARFLRFIANELSPNTSDNPPDAITSKIMYYLREYFLSRLMRRDRARTKKHGKFARRNRTTRKTGL